MSDIRFEADLDTSKLEAATRRANKILADFAKKSETSGMSLGDYLSSSIEKQYSKISKIQSKINDVTEKLIHPAAPLNDAEYGVLRESQLRLAAQRTKEVQQLNVLKLAQQEANKAMQAGTAATEVQTASLGKGMSISAKALVVIGALGTAFAVLKAVITSSLGGTERFSAVMAGAKGALDGFFSTLRNGDLAHFGANIASAAKSAKEFAEETQRYSKVQQSEAFNQVSQDAYAKNLLAIAQSEQNALSQRQDAFIKFRKFQEDNAKQELDNANENYTKLVAITAKRKDIQADWVKENFGQLTPEVVLKSQQLPEGYEDNIEKFQKAYREIKNINKTSTMGAVDMKGIIEDSKKALADFIPVGSNYNEMMLLVAMREELAGKNIDGLAASAKNFVMKKGVFDTIGDTMMRFSNALDLNLEEGSIAKLKQQLQIYTYQYERVKTDQERIDKKADIDRTQELIDKIDIDKVRQKAQSQAEYEKSVNKSLESEKVKHEKTLLEIQKLSDKSKDDQLAESTQRRREQAEVEFRQTLADIKARQAEELEAYNKSPKVGGIKDNRIMPGHYAAALPKEQQAALDKEREDAEALKAAKIIEINSQEEKELKKIRESAAADTLTGLDKELYQIRLKYDEAFKNLNKFSFGPAWLATVAALTKAETKDIAIAKAQYEIEMLDSEETLQDKLNEVRAKGMFRQQKIEDANFKVFQDIADQKIKILDSTGDPKMMMAARILQADLGKAIRDNDKGLQAELILRDAILSNVGELTTAMGNLVGLSKEESSALGDMAQGLATGGIPGFIASFAQQFMKGITSIIDNASGKADKYADKLKEINRLLEKNDHLLKVSSSTGGMGKAYQERIALLQEEIDATTKKYNDMYADMKKANDKWINAGPPPPSLTAINAIIEDSTKKAREDLEAAEAEYQAFLAGGLTSNEVADALRDGFKEGKTAAADFADTFNNFMTTAINAALEEASKPAITEWYKKLTASMASGGGLTVDEKNDLKKDWDKIVADNAALRNAAYSAAGMSPSADIGTPSSTITSTIERSITEETATEMTGLMRKISDDNRQNRDYNKLSVDGIMQTVNELKIIEDILKGQPINIMPQANIPTQAQAPVITPTAPEVNYDTLDMVSLMRILVDDNKKVRDYSSEGISHLAGIEANTYNTVVQLQLAVLELQTIKTNTRPVYTGKL